MSFLCNVGVLLAAFVKQCMLLTHALLIRMYRQFLLKDLMNFMMFQVHLKARNLQVR